MLVVMRSIGEIDVEGSATGSDPVVAAGRLVAVLAAHAEEAERRRRLPVEVLEAVERADLFRLVTPGAGVGSAGVSSPWLK